MHNKALFKDLETWFANVNRQDSNLFVRDPIAKLIRAQVQMWGNWKNKTRGKNKEEFWNYPDKPLSYKEAGAKYPFNQYFWNTPYSILRDDWREETFAEIKEWCKTATLHCPLNERFDYFCIVIEKHRSVKDVCEPFRKDYLKFVEFLKNRIEFDRQWRKEYFDWKKSGGKFVYQDEPIPYKDGENPLSFLMKNPH